MRSGSANNRGGAGNLVLFAAATGGGRGPERSHFSRKQTAFPKAFLRLPVKLRERIRVFESLDMHLQVQVFEELGEHLGDPGKLLYEVSIARKMEDERYQKADEYFVDPTLERIMRGHVVDCTYEVPVSEGAPSRNAAWQWRQIATDMQRKGFDVNGDHPDVKRLNLSSGIYPFRMVSSEEGGETVHIAGVPGLLRLQREQPDHPAFTDGEVAASEILGKLDSLYEIKHIRGVVVETPSRENGGELVFEGGHKIDIRNVRAAHLVGLDKELLLNRGETEIYLGRPLRIWVRGRWLEGTVSSPFNAEGLIDVATGSGNFMVHPKSLRHDVDLRDPRKTEEMEHPLSRYPNIWLYKCVAFGSGSEREMGIISGVSPERKEFKVWSPDHGETIFGFDDRGVDFLPEIDEAPSAFPEIRKGKKITAILPYARPAVDVHRILGFDSITERILAMRVSIHGQIGRRPDKLCYFNLSERAHFEIIGDGEAELDKFPALRRNNQFVPYSRMLGCEVTFSWKGEFLVGTLSTAETLPAYLQVRIRKEHEVAPFADEYDRYDVPFENVIKVTETFEIF